MTTPWSEVASNPQYQALPQDQREAARQQYFAQVVAPQISDPAQVQQARAQFDQQTAGQQLPDITVHPDAPSMMDSVEAGAKDLGRAAVMTGRAVAHGVLGIPTLLHDALVMTPYNAAARALGSDSRINPGSQQLDSMMNSAGIPDPQPRNATERVVLGIDRGAGGLLGGVGVGAGLAGTANQAAQGVGRVLTGNLGAQTAATVAGTGSGELAREAGVGPVGQVAFGLAGGLSPAGVGAAREGIANVGSRLLSSPSPQVAQLAKQAMAEGIPVKASQVSPSRVGKLVDSVTGQVPFSGSQKFSDAQQTAFNRAVARTIGETSDNITSDVFARAKDRIGASYDDLASRIQTKVTPKVRSDLQAVLDEATASGDTGTITAVGNALKRVDEQAASGALPGAAYKSLDSSLGAMVGIGGEKGHFAGKLRTILRDAFTSSAGPSDKAQMAQANEQYANLKTIEPLVASDNVAGNISPAKLMGRVTANKAGKSSMAAGRRGDLGELANIGQKFIKQQIPDSGTAQRVAVVNGLRTVGGAGAGLAAGQVFGGLGSLLAGAGIVGSSRLTQNVLQNPQFVNRLLGAKSPSEIQALLERYSSPALQGGLQAGQ